MKSPNVYEQKGWTIAVAELGQLYETLIVASWHNDCLFSAPEPKAQVHYWGHA